jgi:ABC-2 type transport system ATP-binding protein
MESVIEVENLVHRFGEVTAIDGFNFTVKKGELLALLGPNGAGKTTTVRLINGLFPPTQGRIRMLGMDPVREGDQVRARTGVLTETSSLYERLTAWQNIAFFGTLDGMKDAEWRKRGEELLEFFGLEKRADERVSTYSKGMKQRLALLRALLSNPPVLFLDEPTSGLDPEAALQVHEMLLSIRAGQGQTVVLCTHNLVEAQRLCDRVVVLQHGHMLASGSLEDLRRLYTSGLWVQVDLLEPKADRQIDLTSLSGVIETQSDGLQSIRVHVQSKQVIPDVIKSLVSQGSQLTAVRPEEVSLEDVYFKLQNQARGEKV